MPCGFSAPHHAPQRHAPRRVATQRAVCTLRRLRPAGDADGITPPRPAALRAAPPRYATLRNAPQRNAT